MKSIPRTLIVLLTCAAGTAFAQAGSGPARIEVTGQRIGPPVVAEYACCGVDPAAGVGPARARAEVMADLAAARAGGEYDRLNGEGWAHNVPQRVAVVASREQVGAELAAARASGEYDRLNGEGWAHNVPEPARRSATSVAALR
jgi:hypothetical protein